MRERKSHHPFTLRQVEVEVVGPWVVEGHLIIIHPSNSPVFIEGEARLDAGQELQDFPQV